MDTPTKQASFPREFPGVHYYGEEEEAAVVRVIRQRSPFRYYGASFLAEADTLEKEFAARLGRRYGQAVSSCTNGLISAMAAFGDRARTGSAGARASSGSSTVSAIVRAGGVPVLVEMDDSFTMDPQDLARKITAAQPADHPRAHGRRAEQDAGHHGNRPQPWHPCAGGLRPGQRGKAARQAGRARSARWPSSASR